MSGTTPRPVEHPADRPMGLAALLAATRAARAVSTPPAGPDHAADEQQAAEGPHAAAA